MQNPIADIWNDKSKWFHDHEQLRRVGTTILHRLTDDRIQEECRYLLRLWWHLSMSYQEVAYDELVENVSPAKMTILQELFQCIATRVPANIDQWLEKYERELPIVQDKWMNANRGRDAVAEMLEPTADSVRRQVDAELALISQPELLAAIKPLVIEPRREMRDWDYGAPDEKFPCWIVLEHPRSNTCIAYCHQGIGPSAPWGLLWMTGSHLSIGMDSGWYARLEDAFRQSMIWEGANPPGYEVP